MVAQRKAKEAPLREPTEREKVAMAKALATLDTRPARPTLKYEKDGNVLCTGPSHSDERGTAAHVCETMGSNSNAFNMAGILKLWPIVGGDATAMNAALALLGGVAPRDELEGALAQQMVASHELALEMSRRAKIADRLDTLQAYGNLANKFARTFTAQAEALIKLRTGGKQIVEHRHYNVAPGGQAVIADEFHHHGGAGNAAFAGQLHEPSAALPSPDTQGVPVPVPRDQGQEAVPAPRWAKSRRAKGQPT